MKSAFEVLEESGIDRIHYTSDVMDAMESYATQFKKHLESEASIIFYSCDMLDALQLGVQLMDVLINTMPVGNVRNEMINFNIIANQAINKALGA